MSRGFQEIQNFLRKRGINSCMFGPGMIFLSKNLDRGGRILMRNLYGLCVRGRSKQGGGKTQP